MKKFCKTMSFLFVILIFIGSVQVNADSMLDWIWGSKHESPIVVSDEIPLISVPYEMLTEDEKFLKEAAKIVTDIQISSPLEVCQQKVILKIKTSCSSLTEEQLAKLSVNLLNCQSASEGRKIFPCTEEMSIKQCTTNMDADTWNAYHLISNRARAVCYATRSQQFRALTELTVNKLMQSAHTQIQTLSSLKESQDRLEEQTVTAHKIIESNIEELTEEKALIRAGHTQLHTMAEDIKKKLENASQELLHQATERGKNHEEILKDLENIKTQAQQLWEKIESSTNRIIEQNLEASLQYEETLLKLEKINQTIVFISKLTDNMRTEIDKKLGWITEYIGATGENLEKVYRITLHIVYLLTAMVIAAFLQAPFLTRSAILGMVPLNLASYLKHGLSACLDFVSLTVLILLITAMHYVMNAIQYLIQSRNNSTKESKSHEAPFTNGKTVFNGNTKLLHQSAPEEKKESFWFGIFKLWNNMNEQVFQSIENLKSVYFSIKKWIWQKFISSEELSCSYVRANKYHEKILSSKEYSSMSDDSSEYSDLRDSGKFLLTDDNSITGAVLRRKHVDRQLTPLTAFFKGNREPVIRETSYIPKPKTMPSRSVTPVTRSLCGAKTRSGNPCRLTPSKGQNYCHKHVSGSSIMGD